MTDKQYYDLYDLTILNNVLLNYIVSYIIKTTDNDYQAAKDLKGLLINIAADKIADIGSLRGQL